MSTYVNRPPIEASASHRVALDGGHIDLDTAEGHVELTAAIGGRVGFGMVLSADEAARLAEALSQAPRALAVQAADVDLTGVNTVLDLFDRAEESGIPASALLEAQR